MEAGFVRRCVCGILLNFPQLDSVVECPCGHQNQISKIPSRVNGEPKLDPFA